MPCAYTIIFPKQTTRKTERTQDVVQFLLVVQYIKLLKHNTSRHVRKEYNCMTIYLMLQCIKHCVLGTSIRFSNLIHFFLLHPSSSPHQWHSSSCAIIFVSLASYQWCCHSGHYGWTGPVAWGCIMIFIVAFIPYAIYIQQ